MRRVTDRKALIYPIAVAFCSMLIMGLVSFALVRNLGQQFCGLLVLLDDGYNAPVAPGQPALTERGLRIAKATHELRRSLGCD